jgi:hypothetical protein
MILDAKAKTFFKCVGVVRRERASRRETGREGCRQSCVGKVNNGVLLVFQNPKAVLLGSKITSINEADGPTKPQHAGSGRPYGVDRPRKKPLVPRSSF